jgi:NADH-quinone oxidoreductase E subunit
MPRLDATYEKRARELVALYPQPRSALIPMLHLLQEQDGNLTDDGMSHVAELIGIEPVEVLSVASFYEMFKRHHTGRYLIGVCTNLACLLAGAEELVEATESMLAISEGETTADGLFTLETVECVAHCDKAPCAQVNYRYFGPLDAPGMESLIGDLKTGRLDDDVPHHGTLVRTQREGGLKVSAEQIAKERRAMDRAKADREKAAVTPSEKTEAPPPEAAKPQAARNDPADKPVEDTVDRATEKTTKTSGEKA